MHPKGSLKIQIKSETKMNEKHWDHFQNTHN